MFSSQRAFIPKLFIIQINVSFVSKLSNFKFKIELVGFGKVVSVGCITLNGQSGNVGLLNVFVRIRGTDSRFLNLFEIVVWSENISGNWEGLDRELQEVLAFLIPNKELINTLAVLCDLIKNTSKELKIKRIQPKTLANLQALWQEVPP